jgi:hypothetical protein
VQANIEPAIREWANNCWWISVLVGLSPKEPQNHSGTDIDLLISLSQSVTNTLKENYETLFTKMAQKGYLPKRQNVSINIK